MESDDQPPRREANERGVDEARVMIARAERAWRRQVGDEEAAGPAVPRPAWRWLLLGVALAAIVFLLFERLGQLG